MSQTAEPLTGRKYEFMLYPLSFRELMEHNDFLTEKRLLEHRLIYGSYPEIVTSPGEEKELIRLLADSYLYKDILTLELIKKPAMLDKLLKALALQLGNEVSNSGLSRFTGLDSKSIERCST
jgi:uncharacterized protein